MKKDNLFRVLKSIYFEYDSRTTNRVKNTMPHFSPFIFTFFDVWNLYLDVYGIEEKKAEELNDESFVSFLKDTYNILFNEEDSDELVRKIKFNHLKNFKNLIEGIKKELIKRKDFINEKKVEFEELKKLRDGLNTKTREMSLKARKLHTQGIEEQIKKMYNEFYSFNITRSSYEDMIKKHKKGIYKLEKLDLTEKTQFIIDNVPGMYDQIINTINNIIKETDLNQKIKLEDKKLFLKFINNYTSFEIYSMMEIEIKRIPDLENEVKDLEDIKNKLEIIKKAKSKQPK